MNIFLAFIEVSVLMTISGISVEIADTQIITRAHRVLSRVSCFCTKGFQGDMFLA